MEDIHDIAPFPLFGYVPQTSTLVLMAACLLVVVFFLYFASKRKKRLKADLSIHELNRRELRRIQRSSQEPRQRLNQVSLVLRRFLEATAIPGATTFGSRELSIASEKSSPPVTALVDFVLRLEERRYGPAKDDTDDVIRDAEKLLPDLDLESLD